MTTEGRAVAALVLAAGQGTRFAAQTDGAFKLLAEFRGMPLVRHAAVAALGSRARFTVVVTGHRRDGVLRALDGLAVREVFNPDYATGLASSLRTGIASLPTETEAALVLLADMPGVSAALIDTLIDAFERNPGCDAVFPVLAGQRGNPVLLSASLFPSVLTLRGDEGARRLLVDNPRVVEVPVANQAATFDIDTPDSLLTLRSR